MPKNPAKIDNMGSPKFYQCTWQPKFDKYNRRNKNNKDRQVIKVLPKGHSIKKKTDQKEWNGQNSGKTNCRRNIFVLFKNNGNTLFGISPSTKRF